MGQQSYVPSAGCWGGSVPLPFLASRVHQHSLAWGPTACQTQFPSFCLLLWSFYLPLIRTPGTTLGPPGYSRISQSQVSSLNHICAIPSTMLYSQVQGLGHEHPWGPLFAHHKYHPLSIFDAVLSLPLVWVPSHGASSSSCLFSCNFCNPQWCLLVNISPGRMHTCFLLRPLLPETTLSPLPDPLVHPSRSGGPAFL